MSLRRGTHGRLLVVALLSAALVIGASTILTVADAPCLKPTPGKGPKCADVFCGPCEELACGGRGRCDFICVPIPGCVP